MPPFADSRGHTGDPTQERHGRALGSRDLRQRGRGLSWGLVPALGPRCPFTSTPENNTSQADSPKGGCICGVWGFFPVFIFLEKLLCFWMTPSAPVTLPNALESWEERDGSPHLLIKLFLLV